jgi:hypothetical protein
MCTQTQTGYLPQCLSHSHLPVATNNLHDTHAQHKSYRKWRVNSNKCLQICGNFLAKFPFQTAGESTKAKFVLHPFKTTVVHRYYDNLQVHHPCCVFMQMWVGGSVKTRLLYDRDLLVWQWLHVSAVLGHLQFIRSFTINNNKEKTYTLDNVFT